jgi:hypothetical protein
MLDLPLGDRPAIINMLGSHAFGAPEPGARPGCARGSL